MNCFLVSFILSCLAFSFGEELKILPALKQYWVIEGSTVNLTCIHNGTLSSQEHALSFWRSNTQILTGNGFSVSTYAVADTQDVTRTIRTLVITKLDFQFSDGVPYKCIVGHNISNYLGEAVIDVRVLEFQSAEYIIYDLEKKYLESIPQEEDNCIIIDCSASGVNPRDTSFNLTTQFLKVSEGKEQVLWNSSKYTIFTENNTLEIIKPGREDAGEYRCLLIFNKEDKSNCQEVRSQPIYVKAVPKIETHNEDKVLFLGETLELRCTASGFPKPNITWMKDGKALNQTERVHPKEEQLVIYSLRYADMGDYQCVASHDQFHYTDSATMHVSVNEIKDVQSGGRGYMKDYLWAYILFLLWLLQCGLYAGPKL